MHLGGVDQRHIDIPDASASLAAVEQRVIAMTNGHLENSLTNIIIDGRARDAKKQSQLVPALEQVLERVAETGVGLNALVVELSEDPSLELGHHRRAVSLINGEALVVRQRLPYTLVLTKTRALFTQDAAEHATWARDLAWLRGSAKTFTSHERAKPRRTAGR